MSRTGATRNRRRFTTSYRSRPVRRGVTAAPAAPAPRRAVDVVSTRSLSGRRPAALLAGALREVVGRLCRALIRLEHALGGGKVGAGEITDAELRALVAANRRLAPEERHIIDEVLTAGARHVSAVMVPRTDVVYLAAGLEVSSAAALVADAPHSRFPVIDGTHDDVVGFVHVRDLMRRSGGGETVGALAREIHRVPASKNVLAALSEMRDGGHHVAVVVDEYGGTDGIVTLEDLIEELVGEIRDEYDAVPEPVPIGDVDGRIHLADFAERYGFELPPGPYESLGGFLMARLGRLPMIGDEVRVDGWRLLVRRCEGHRVGRVAVRRIERPGAPAQPGVIR